MATEKQRAAARRNIKKAQAAAAAKRTSADVPKITKRAPSSGRDLVAAPDAPKKESPPDVGTVAALILRLTTEKSSAAVEPAIKNAQAPVASKLTMAGLKAKSIALSIIHDVAAALTLLNTRKLSGLGVLVVSILIWSAVIVMLVVLNRNQQVPAGGRLVATATPRVVAPRATSGNSSPSVSATESVPSPPLTGTSSTAPPATAESRDRVALRTETLVAEAWRDIAGTVRVHVVVSATNDTNDVRTLASGERAFRLISAAGQTLHTGRFAYAFPSIVPPGGVSHLITTVVLPLGADGTDLRVETQVLADVTSAVQPILQVSDIYLRADRPGVGGIVRNTGAEEVRFGVVAVLGRDATGRIIGGFYDNVNVASIAVGGEASFETEYPGLPPAAAGRIADLTGVAFDAGPSIPR